MDKEKLGKLYIKNKELNSLLELFSFSPIYGWNLSTGNNEPYIIEVYEKKHFDYKDVYKKIDEIVSDISLIDKGGL
ncbi:hypothetical protein [Lactococcus lactis]